MSTVADDLMQTSLGALLERAEAEHLVQQGKERTIRAGDCLFRAGDDGHALYVVLSGTLEVILGQAGANAQVVATVGAGQVVGELEVMTNSLRVATLSATVDATVIEISGATLEAMLAKNHPAGTKVISYLAKTLARRLAAVNQRIVERPRAAPAAPPPIRAAAEPEDVGDDAEPLEIDDAEIEPIGDDDLDVLDKLWSD